jgi:hypothetical protein
MIILNYVFPYSLFLKKVVLAVTWQAVIILKAEFFSVIVMYGRTYRRRRDARRAAERAASASSSG